MATKSITTIVRSLEPSKRKQLFIIQKKYISIETKLMFERDRNTKLQLKAELKELNAERLKIIQEEN